MNALKKSNQEEKIERKICWFTKKALNIRSRNANRRYLIVECVVEPAIDDTFMFACRLR